MVTVWCGLCHPSSLWPADEFWAHLEDEHGVVPEFETWPDGEVVVLDTTLEPEDFAA